MVLVRELVFDIFERGHWRKFMYVVFGGNLCLEFLSMVFLS